MTKKEYILVAEALHKTRPALKEKHEVEWEQWYFTYDAIANALQANSTRFNRETFRQAVVML